mgnify:CR=1 FL=1
MEYSLHRQLKSLYADDESQTEVSVGRYRVDAVRDGELVEIQHAALGAIRDKIGYLLKEHDVRVVKPLLHRRTLVTCTKKGRVLRRRQSPKRGDPLELFEELVHFTRVFPHPRLTLELLLVNVEEWRVPAPRRWRRKYEVQDRRLLEIAAEQRLRTTDDLRAFVGAKLPDPFDTQEMATAIGVDRFFAQQIAYCLRKTGAARQVGKRGNALLYSFADAA